MQNKELNLEECQLLRLLCKISLNVADDVEARDRTLELVLSAQKALESAESRDLLQAQKQAVLTSGLYWIKIQLCLNVENCKVYYLSLLKAIHQSYPEDFLITKIYAKSLLLLHGTIYFALSLDEMMEDSDSKKQLDEA